MKVPVVVSDIGRLLEAMWYNLRVLHALLCHGQYELYYEYYEYYEYMDLQA